MAARYGGYAVLADLDRIALRLDALDSHRVMAEACREACIPGVASVTVKRGELSCRCVRIDLGVHREVLR